MITGAMSIQGKARIHRLIFDTGICGTIAQAFRCYRFDSKGDWRCITRPRTCMLHAATALWLRLLLSAPRLRCAQAVLARGVVSFYNKLMVNFIGS